MTLSSHRTSAEQALSGIPKINGVLTWADWWDHVLARWGYKRMRHTVEPGLYRIGEPDETSPVFVTANYTLSFDALRSALAVVDGFILVLDTHGVNVWCAAGEGTFGTDEMVGRIESVKLKEIVSHRRLILPQLGAPGVAAHMVKKRSGFKVEYGPVRAADLPEYLERGEATEEMRRMFFPFMDRLVLIPVELVAALAPVALTALVVYALLGAHAAVGIVAAALAGLVAFPALLPWLPGREFSVKGFALGAAIAAPLVYTSYCGTQCDPIWEGMFTAAFLALSMPAVTAFLALNFTGSTTFTSPTGVRREIDRYVPVMAVMAGVAVVLAAAYPVTLLAGAI